MRITFPLLLATTCSTVAVAAPPPVQPDPNVRVYRCVSTHGGVALQDAPCQSGHQQVLDLQRPIALPPRLTASGASTITTTAPPPQEVRIITVQPPQPMYECFSPEGERYTSDRSEGQLRWVPTWGPAYIRGGLARRPYRPRPGIGEAMEGDRRLERSVSRSAGEIDSNVIVPYGSVQIRDECHALPPQEVCARLSDRRWELIRRYNSALQSERKDLSREQRGIEARQQRDCGGV